MASLELDITCALRAFELIAALRLERERVALVGPSGAGKSTILRAIAGLRRPDAGRIAAGGETWFDHAAGVDLPPERRSVGMVFQDYALFPHLTVRGNVGFGGAPGGEDELLERFGIAALADQRPDALSGGERQRVALARALAREPRLLLLDEPLSALDAQTRSEVRDGLHDILEALDLPTLVVTHDWRDAVALAGRIGVLVEGRMRRVGTPGELVERPGEAFVARFTGANVLPGLARPAAGGCVVRLDAGPEVTATTAADGPVGIAVQPWEVRLAPPETAEPGHVALTERVLSVAPDGGRRRVRLATLVAEVEAGAEPAEGASVSALIPAADVRLVAL